MNKDKQIKAFFKIIKPYVIGVSGGTGSGKDVVCDKVKQKIQELFGTLEGNLTIVNQDSFYFGGSAETNYDVPDAIDFKLMSYVIMELIKGNSVECPIYDFTTHSRKTETETLYPAKIIIIQGILIFTQEEILKLCDKKIFVFATELVRFMRRRERDIKERGRTAEEVFDRWKKYIRDSDENYVGPSSRHAGFEIKNDRDGHYENLDILIDHIVTKIRESDTNIGVTMGIGCTRENLVNLINSLDESKIHILKELLNERLSKNKRKQKSKEIYG